MWSGCWGHWDWLTDWLRSLDVLPLDLVRSKESDLWKYILAKSQTQAWEGQQSEGERERERESCLSSIIPTILDLGRWQQSPNPSSSSFPYSIVSHVLMHILYERTHYSQRHNRLSSNSSFVDVLGLTLVHRRDVYVHGLKVSKEGAQQPDLARHLLKWCSRREHLWLTLVSTTARQNLGKTHEITSFGS